MRKLFLLGSVTVAAVFATVLAAQAKPQEPMKIHQLSPTAYWAEGGGGNSGIIIGENGVIVIDAKNTPDDARELLDNIAKITPKPVKAIIITHNHKDHWAGLDAFPAEIPVIAHVNNEEGLAAAIAAGKKAGLPADRPTHAVTTTREDFEIEGVKLQIYHWAPAHTNCDLVVYLPAQKLVFTTDIMITASPLPMIFWDKHGNRYLNGSSEGWLVSSRGIAALDFDRFVPGHGDVSTRDDFVNYLHTVESSKTQVEALIARGLTFEQIRTAMKIDPPKPGAPNIPGFEEVVYMEITGIKPASSTW